MKQILRSAALALVAFSVSLSAAPGKQRLPSPQPQVQVAAPAPAPAPARPSLWKVSDSDTTIYLFGTIHVLPKGIDWFGGKIEQAFDSSQELVTEIVESEPGQMQAAVTGQGNPAAGHHAARPDEAG